MQSFTDCLKSAQLWCLVTYTCQAIVPEGIKSQIYHFCIAIQGLDSLLLPYYNLRAEWFPRLNISCLNIELSQLLHDLHKLKCIE